MKNFKLFSIILSISAIMLLTGCETTPDNGDDVINNNTEIEVIDNNLGEDEAFNTIQALTNLHETNIEVESTNIRRLDHTNLYGDNNEIPGFSVTFSGLAYNDVPNIDRVFDGRHLEYIGDGVLSSVVEYRKDGVVCYVHSFPEQEIPYELVEREGDYGSDEYNNAWDEFMNNVSYEITYECANLPEGAINYEDRYFDIFSSIPNDPFFSAAIRGSNLYMSNEYGINGRYYFSEFSKDGDSVTFEGYDNITTLKKEECTDYAGLKHDYSATLVIEGDMVYAGCAEPSNLGGLIIGEQGFLSTFNKKTGLDIAGGEYTRYEVMEMVGDYVQVSIDNYINDEFVSNQILLERESDGWNILYEGDYNPDPDTCEELNQYDMDLMDMSLFYSCPRG